MFTLCNSNTDRQSKLNTRQGHHNMNKWMNMWLMVRHERNRPFKIFLISLISERQPLCALCAPSIITAVTIERHSKHGNTSGSGLGNDRYLRASCSCLAADLI